MFADTKMTVKVFAISHQRVLMFWTLAFCTLIFIANASSSEIHGYESNRFYQAMDFLTYFSLITSFSLGFVFHKTRPGAWLNRLPVHRSALILVPFVCLTFISLLIFVFMSKQWELMAGLMNGSPIARFVLMPVVVFEISRHSRRQMSGLLFSVISVVCIWFTSTKMSMVTGGVFTFRSEAFFGIFAVALAAILEQKRLGAILGASVYAASCLSVPLVFSGLYKVNQPLENLVASHNYFPTENTKKRLIDWTQSTSIWPEENPRFPRPWTQRTAVEFMKVYADQFLDDSEKALYVQNIALKWRSFTDPVGRGQSAEMMSEQDLQDYDIPLNLENVGPNALEWLLKNLNSHPASCSLLPVHLDAPFLERVLQSDNCSWAMPRFWEVAKTRVVNPLAQEPLPFSNISPKVLARLKGVRERSSNVKEKRAEMNLLAKSTAGEARRVLLSRLNSASDDGELNSLTLLASNFMNNLRFGSYKYPVIWEGRPGVWESAFQIWTYRKTSNFDWASSLDLQIRYFTAPENWKEIQEKIL